MSMPVISHSAITRSQAIADIIESVALEQTGLSHILNAEGEKIQKVISTTSVTAPQMLAINKSVRCMVNTIAKLEMALQMKLELFTGEICATV